MIFNTEIREAGGLGQDALSVSALHAGFEGFEDSILSHWGGERSIHFSPISLSLSSSESSLRGGPPFS